MPDSTHPQLNLKFTGSQTKRILRWRKRWTLCWSELHEVAEEAFNAEAFGGTYCPATARVAGIRADFAADVSHFWACAGIHGRIDPRRPIPSLRRASRGWSNA